MGVRFACHGCGKALNIKTELAGKRGKCPKCNIRFRIPKSDQDFSIPLQKDAATAAVSNAGERSEVSNQGQNIADSSVAAATVTTDDRLPSSSESASHSQAPAAAPQPTEPQSTEPTPSNIGMEEDFNPLDEHGVLWYVRPPTGGRYGPADGPTVTGWATEGRITPDTLLWREGWPQWRECREVLPEQYLPETSKPSGSQSPQPTAEQPAATPPPAIDTTPAEQPTASSGYDPDNYLGARKRRKAKQRATMIAVLIATSLLLIVALVVALWWQGQRAKEEQSQSFRQGAHPAVPASLRT